MARWEALMPIAGGGQKTSWQLEFFGWLRRQLIVVEDWPYAGTDFTGDPNLSLLEGEYWDEELGKNIFHFMSFMIFWYTCMF